ncbi:GNAT family N-acetyltransferase [Sphingomonas sp. KR1UV-12]|uniref:GNAT family N-acetyltransferase n=1 Tax=Sphingomonas aurea TaxID=3063994 RepID=A0ABT9EKW1_9SPHN|nr:GNAT family N-acetyltransferase [Sphingomonas sp. KR1UV-12]MDP1027485.1 GNAT family N-acetyltransferase [Sphingomonas sp. KR1UV-12]
MTPPELLSNPDDSVRDAILAPLIAHNEAMVGPTDRRTVAIVLRGDDNAVTGGLWGVTGFRWLFVQYLAVPAALKGQGHGRTLMRMAEEEARRLGCVGVWLDTFSFQARGFYEKLGYAVIGRIDDFPPGESRFFLRKRID